VPTADIVAGSAVRVNLASRGKRVLFERVAGDESQISLVAKPSANEQPLPPLAIQSSRAHVGSGARSMEQDANPIVSGDVEAAIAEAAPLRAL